MVRKPVDRDAASAARRAPRRRLPTVAAVVVLALAPLLAVSCGGNKNASSSAPGTTAAEDLSDLGDIVDNTGKKEVTVEVGDNFFKAKGMKVSPGTKVTFNSTGANVHNVTPVQEGLFPVIALKPGESGSMTAPQNPGTYRYYCTLHGGRTTAQHGALIVAA